MSALDKEELKVFTPLDRDEVSTHSSVELTAEQFHQRALKLYRQEKYKEALADFDSALRINPKHSLDHCYRGVCLTYLKRYHDSLNAFNKAIELDPRNTLNYRALSECYYKMGMETLAFKAINTALEIDPRNSENFRIMGNLYKLAGKHDEALSAYQEAIASTPKVYNLIKIYKSMSDCYRNKTDYIKTAEYYGKAFVADKKGELTSYGEYGQTLYKAKRYEEALAFLQHEKYKDPAKAKNHHDLGLVLNILGRKGEAKIAIVAALKIDPTYRSAQENFEKLFGVNVKQHQELLKLCDEKLRGDPKNSAEHYTRGTILENLGDTEEAIKAYQTSLTLNRKNPEAQRRFQALTGGKYETYTKNQQKVAGKLLDSSAKFFRRPSRDNSAEIVQVNKLILEYVNEPNCSASADGSKEKNASRSWFGRRS